METKTSKIKEIKYLREFSGQYGLMFVYTATMENGEYGDINVKEAGKYKAGDELTYELTSREFNGKTTWMIKVQAPQKPAFAGGNFGGGKGESVDKQNQISRMAAIKAAVDLIVADKIPLQNLLFEADRITNYILTGK